MKIIKISSRKDWQKYIEEFKQELEEKDIDKKGKKIRNKFFNYIKTKNIKTPFFHGTSEELYEKMKENEYMMSPIYLKSTQYEKRNEALDKVFFTKNIEQANFYKRRAEKQTGTKGIILVLNIPIYRIAEIQATIFDSNTYNEGRGLINIRNIINKYMSYLINDFDEYKDKLIDEILKIINNYNHPEFTVYGMIPTNQTKSGFQYIKEADEIEVEQWIQWVEENKIHPLNIPEQIQKQITDVNKWIEWTEWIDDGKFNPLDIPEQIQKQISEEKWIEWIEDPDKTFSLLDISENIKQKISVNKWIEWVDNGKLTHPLHMPKEKRQQIIDVNQWIQWVEKGKIHPFNIPKQNRQQIEDVNQWIQWVEEKIIDPINMPEQIEQQITDVNQWIQWVDKKIIKKLKHIPEQIEQQIPIDKWIEWIKRDDIYLTINDAPDYIIEYFDQQKESMNWFKFIKRNVK